MKNKYVFPREGTRAGATEANLVMEDLNWCADYIQKYAEIEAQGDGTKEDSQKKEK